MFTLPSLPYAYGALEPYIDLMTMEIHHNKHHQGYVNKLNTALADYPEWQNKTLPELLTSFDKLPQKIVTAVRNNGGGNFNHTMFWTLMKKGGGDQPKGKVGEAIKKHFSTFEAFQNEFNMTAKTVFGSGWAWLVVDKKGDLIVMPTANQDCPITEGFQPIMGLDVWEHAYYLKYQNRRPDYITAWWHVINWEQVEENYHNIIG